MTEPLRVGIDITSVLYGRGVSRYTTNLTRHLLANNRVKMSLYGTSLRQKSELEKIAKELKAATEQKAHTVIRNYPPSLYNFLWYKLGYPKIRSAMPDISLFHSWDWLQPPDRDLPLISTIHDLAMFQFPETAHPQILDMHRKSWEVLKKRNAHIIAVSRATKNDVINHLGIPAERIHVVHEALPDEVVLVSNHLTEARYEQLKLELQLTKPYILFVGTREPRKNLTRLIAAWQSLNLPDLELLIAGSVGWDKTNDLGKTPGLRFLDRVSDEALSVLYGEASVFAFPSLYEGFGLPILEAFHHGTPVVTSNTSSMPEVAGNAAELVDPLSEDSIAQALKKILNESVPEQQKRLQKMIIRSQMFGWQRVADQTIDAYEQTVQTFVS
ncbi:MAG: glycosyltransferase family 1 protein [bacterium]|nr:glycosyltransferase family 1 protein [bacterium]